MKKEDIRVALNKINLLGAVKEVKLKEGKNKDNGKEYINGSLVLKCGEFKEVEIRTFVNKLTRSNKVAKNYETLSKFISGELGTMANSDIPTVISIYGNKEFLPKITEQRYANKESNEAITRLSLDLGFGSIKVKTEVEPEEYKAEFEVEMYVESINDEVNKETEEETGRVKVKGYVPTYGGDVFPMNIMFGVIKDKEGEFDFAEQIRDEIEEGDTLDIWGDINFQTIITKVKKGGTLGRAKIEEKTEYINEFVAEGADLIEGDKEYDEEIISFLTKERKLVLEEIEQKANSNESKGQGLGTKRTGEKRKDREIKF